jgi:integrase
MLPFFAEHGLEAITVAEVDRYKARRLDEGRIAAAQIKQDALLALIEAADRYHRPMVATLAGAGLRVMEILALDWHDVNLATGTLTVGQAKTAAAYLCEPQSRGG